jgi:starch synthase
MRVVHVTSEVAPYSRTGGLGDVLGALPPSQRRAGIDAIVVAPRYGNVDPAGLTYRGSLSAPLAGEHFVATVWDAPDASVRFVDVPGLLDRPRPYGDEYGEYGDNALRFAVFCRAAAELAASADVVHLHDWQAGLTALYLGGRKPLVHTVHNLAYQGVYDLGWAPRLGVPPERLSFDGLEFHGRLNLLKAGLTAADRLTTVSPRYAHEIRSEPGGNGLSGLFQHRGHALSGILNGIDVAAWDPTTDPVLPAPFDAEDRRGKARCKEALLADMGLSDGPLIGVVSRAAWQKGLDLVADAIDAIVGLGVRMVLLTDGERWLIDRLRYAAGRHPGRLAIRTVFDDALARRIYAGSDFVLVPSRFEPCGLTQMYGMRYGAVPIVRATGGLADTVRDGETGVAFDEPSAHALVDAVRRAVELYQRPAAYAAVQAAGMRADWSWEASARAYEHLYRDLLRGRS